MKLGLLVLVAGVTACTSASAVRDPYDAGPDESRAPDASTSDSGLEAATSGGDAGPCADCEYFPETCSADVLCPNGPFNPDSPRGSLDRRTSINVIRGRSLSDVWVAGSLGALAHFDGTSWTRSDLGTRETMRALWLLDSAEVSFGLLQRVYARGIEVQDGGAEPSAGGWTELSPSYLPGQAAVLTVSATSAWAAPGSDWLWCAEWLGGLWRMRQSASGVIEGRVGILRATCTSVGCNEVFSIHGSSANELWAVGEQGATVRITNASGDMPSVKAFNSQTRKALHGVWEPSMSEAWSVGVNGTIRHYTGNPMIWDVVEDVPTNVDLNAVWGSSSTDVWAVGDAGVVLHYDGTSWARVKVAGLGVDRPNFTAVWVAAPGHVWIGGQGMILSLGGKP